MKELTRPLGHGLMPNLGAGVTEDDGHAGGTPVDVDLGTSHPALPFVQASALIGRLGLEAHLVALLRTPGLGHWFGTSWLVLCRTI